VLRPQLIVLLVWLFVMACALAACSGSPQGNAADGGRWYRLHRCEGCHGEGGRGGRAPTLNGSAISYRRFLNKLRTPDSTIMPAYGPEELPEEDAADIFLWLQKTQR